MKTKNQFFEATWAIRPESLQAMIQQFPDCKTAAEFSARFSRKAVKKGYVITAGGVALLPMYGPFFKYQNIFSFFFGGTALSYLSGVFSEMLKDPAVKAIVLDIDSPGGTVAGTEAFGELVYSARGQKPVVAFGSGQMASAAYWIASAADKVVVEKTTDVGSIGVILVHSDWSGRDEQIGLKRSVLYAGKYKALGNDAEPLSDLAKETFQKELDYLYTMFIDTVARNRNTSPEAVLGNMADGRVFIGQQAVDAGLADQIGSLNSAVNEALSMTDIEIRYFSIPEGEEAQAASPKKEKEISMKGFMEQVEDYQAQNECSMTEAILAIQKQDPKSHEDFIRISQPDAFDPDPQESAAQIAGAEKQAFMSIINEYREKRGFKPTRTEAMIQVMKTTEGRKAHIAYIVAANK